MEIPDLLPCGSQSPKMSRQPRFCILRMAPYHFPHCAVHGVVNAGSNFLGPPPTVAQSRRTSILSTARQTPRCEMSPSAMERPPSAADPVFDRGSASGDQTDPQKVVFGHNGDATYAKTIVSS